MKKEICPRCGSMIKNNYCVKCGPANNFYVEKLTKNDKKTDLELFMKDSYKKAKYNNNLFLIFIMGPLYYSYYKLYFLGFILFAIEFFLCFYVHNLLFYLGFGMFSIILFYICSRTLYLLFTNILLLKLMKLKLNIIRHFNKTTRT